MQRRRQHQEQEFNHTSAKARLRAAQKRLKRLVDVFAQVAATVPGVQCPEHLYERYVDVTNQVRGGEALYSTRHACLYTVRVHGSRSSRVGAPLGSARVHAPGCHGVADHGADVSGGATEV